MPMCRLTMSILVNVATATRTTDSGEQCHECQATPHFERPHFQPSCNGGSHRSRVPNRSTNSDNRLREWPSRTSTGLANQRWKLDISCGDRELVAVPPLYRCLPHPPGRCRLT